MALLSWLLTALAVIPSTTLFVQGQTFPNPGSCTKAENPPPGPSGQPAVCDVKGTAQAIASTQLAASAEQCRNLCLRRVGIPGGFYAFREPCFSFAYDKNFGTCYLYSDIVANIGFGDNQNPELSSRFFDARCFTCPQICPPTRGLNVFDDATFDLSSTLYGPWYQSITDSDASPNGTIVQPGLNSPYAFHFPPGNDMTIGQDFDGCNNQLYIFSFNYKILCHNGCDPSMQISIGDYEAYAVPSWHSFFTNDAWAIYEDYFHSEGTGTELAAHTDAVSVRFLNNNDTAPSSVEVFLDSFNASPVKYSQNQPKRLLNLVQNGGFETGSLAPWRVTSRDGQITDRVAKGGLNDTAYAYHIDGPPFSSATIQQSISTRLQRGKRYILQYDYRASNQTYINFALKGQGQGMTSFAFEACVDGNPCSATVRRIFFAREEGVKLQVYMQLQGSEGGSGNQNQTAVIDNVSLEKFLISGERL